MFHRCALSRMPLGQIREVNRDKVECAEKSNLLDGRRAQGLISQGQIPVGQHR